MDGLDTYIDDYGKPDPIPLSMLRRMNQSAVLGLFDEEADAAAPEAPLPAAAGGGFSRWFRRRGDGRVDAAAAPPDIARTPRR